MTLKELDSACEFLVERFPIDPESEHAEAEMTFLFCWCHLADAGAVDGYGGAECRRVYGEWVAAGRPLPLTRWMEAKGYLPELDDDDDDDDDDEWDDGGNQSAPD